MAPKSKLHFARFEFKYILRNTLSDELERELGYFMGLDPFVAAQADRRYFVRSLYYDDPYLTNYYDKTEGIRTRAKFRVRTYTNASEASCVRFLELKGRHNNLVFKHRTPLEGWMIGNGHGGGMSREVTRSAVRGPVSEQFQYELFRKQIRPVMLIDYLRRPYVSKYDPEFRVTFDGHLHATRTDRLFPKASQNSRKFLPGYSIMEVKFRYHLPAWFHRLIQSYELKRVSVSKVCKGIDAWELVPNLDD